LIGGGERERTLSLSAFIFKVLGSVSWDGAPNFPPHDLDDFDGINIATYGQIKEVFLGPAFDHSAV
jgi:hypothetical protein